MLVPSPHELYDDGLIYQEHGSRAQSQTAFVRHYLDAVSQEMDNAPICRRSFVQLFAEAGLYRNRDTQEWFVGAALHALNLTGFNHYIYTSLNQQVLATLEQRHQTFFPRSDAEVHFMGGNCNDLARGIVSESEFQMLSRRSRNGTPAPSVALTFCLCQNDVYLLWETLVAISRLPYVNLILYYPMEALNRQMAQAYDQRGETAVDAFFGGKAWRDLYRRGYGQNRHELLIPYYCDRLRALGFSEVVTEQDLHLMADVPDHEAPTHCLLFAHKQPKSLDFWDAVMDRG